MSSSLVDTLSRLPASSGITCRGMSGPAPQNAITVSTVMPNSADPRIASEKLNSGLPRNRAEMYEHQSITLSVGT